MENLLSWYNYALLCRLLEEQGELLAEQAVRLQELETCKFDGPLIWKVQVLDHQGTRVANRFHSPAMYTGCPGYKLCCTLKLDDPHRSSTCMYVQLITGTYDDRLHFPFNGICNITVQDQNQSQKQQKFDIPCRGLLQRPMTSTAQEQPFSAKVNFLPTEELFSDTYLKDGVVYIKVVVRTDSNLPELFNDSLHLD